MMNLFKKAADFLLALSLCILFLILFIKTAFILKPLFYMDIKVFNLEKISGRSYIEIKDTYSYIIDFLTNYSMKIFKLPNFIYTSNGEAHFYEVKRLLFNIDMLYYFIIVFSMLILLSLHHYFDYNFLKIASLILLSSTFALIFGFIINFNRSFTIFHQLFFRNNYWLFDPNKDPVINILPEGFFLHCALFIMSLLICAGIFFLLLYKRKQSNPL